MTFAFEFIRDNLGEEFVPEGMPAIEKVFKNYDSSIVVIIKEKGT